MYRNAHDQGLTSFKTAKSPQEIDAVIRNTFIQGTLSIVFAVLVLIVVAAGVVAAVRALRGSSGPSDEDQSVPSRIFAPSGLFPTRAEKEVARQWDELARSSAKSVGSGVD